MILDEPTSSLTERETELLFAQIDDLHRHGLTAIYISHRLHEFERIADVCTVMRDGAVVDHFRLKETGGDTPRRVIRAMVGRELSEMYPKTSASVGLPILTLKDWCVSHMVAGRPDVVRNVTISVRAGEVLGIFGLLGAGAFKLARSIFGASPARVRGTIEICGTPVDINGPMDAIRHGIAYLPAERKRDSLILSHSIATNMSIAALSRLSRLGAVDRDAELRSIRHYIENLHVKCASIEQPIRELSGGNQQKVVAAKWLMTAPDVFVLEEPTRGVDVNARIDFYELINKLAADGKAVILVSTDLPEVLGMADRLVLMWEGQIAREFKRGEVTEEEVMLHAAGEHEAAA